MVLGVVEEEVGVVSACGCSCERWCEVDGGEWGRESVTLDETNWDEVYWSGGGRVVECSAGEVRGVAGVATSSLARPTLQTYPS